MQTIHNLISSEHDPGEPIIECSTLRRLLRITAHVFKVIEVLKAKIGKDVQNVEFKSPLLTWPSHYTGSR